MLIFKGKHISKFSVSIAMGSSSPDYKIGPASLSDPYRILNIMLRTVSSSIYISEIAYSSIVLTFSRTVLNMRLAFFSNGLYTTL